MNVKEKAPVQEKKKKGRMREGVVVKNKMQKTILVEITRLVQHPRYKKIVRNKIRYAVHDEKNEAKAGDKVRITETRARSKTKHWRLLKVIGK